MTDTVLITGNTFPVKDQIKALGGQWDSIAKGWRVPASKADEAKTLVAGALKSTAPTPRRVHISGRRYECPECGDFVYPGSRCWETGCKH